MGNATVCVVSYVWFETVAYALAAAVMIFFGVERYIVKDRKTILERQKAEAEAAGIEWVEPEERLRREEAEYDRLAEEARKAELADYCEKKGLSFEEEEKKYQDKLAAKRAKAEARAKKKGE